MKSVLICFILSCFLLPKVSFSQESEGALDKMLAFPKKFLSDVDKKTSSLEGQVTQVSTSYLKRLSKQENKLKKKLAKTDSSEAARLFPNGMQTRYDSYIKNIRSDSGMNNKEFSGIYYPNTDSLQMSLAFLKANPQLLSKANISSAQLDAAMNKLSVLQGKLNYSGQINDFVAQRKQQFQQLLAKYTNLPNGIKNAYSNYQKQAAYYSDQIKAYKESLNDPDKVMNMAMAVLYKVPSFNHFVKSNSVLSGLFPGSPNIDSTTATQGIQTRKQVQDMLNEKMGTQGMTGISKMQSNMQSAQGMVDGLRDKLNASGGNDLNMPDFQLNDQRSKSFLHRIEYGANLQTTRNSYFFPITTDLAVSVGYRLNKSNIVGFGLAYKIGWGPDIHHIQLSSQGVGVRSFADIKIKKTFFLSGGFEYNYQQPFNPLHLLDYGLQNWTKSGLIGVSQIVPLKSKFLKKSKIQLLWDFLSYQQIPKTQPFIFRVGYSF